MSTKQIVLDAVSQLPEDATFEGMQEEIDSGRSIPHDCVRELVRQ